MKAYPLCLIALGLSCVAESGTRDPFWPIGYTPGAAVAPIATSVPTAPEKDTLSKELLDTVVRDEVEKIKRSGTLVFGNQIKAYVRGKWVAKGDRFRMDIQGQPFEIEILELTTDNIELVPHRITVTAQP